MSITVWYGFEISSEVCSEEAMLTLYDMNEVIPSPFRICALASSDSLLYTDVKHIIIGFPVGSLKEVMESAEELRDWMRDNPLFYDIDYCSVPGFYGGFEWSPDSMQVDSDVGTDSEYSDESAESEDDYESDSDAV